MQINFKRSVLLMSCLLAISCSSKVKTSFQCLPEDYPLYTINAAGDKKQVELEIVSTAADEWPDLKDPRQQVQAVNADQTIEWRFGPYSRFCRSEREACEIIFKISTVQASLSKEKKIVCLAHSGGAYSCKLAANELSEFCPKTEKFCAFSYTIKAGKKYRDPVIIVRPPR